MFCDKESAIKRRREYFFAIVITSGVEITMLVMQVGTLLALKSQAEFDYCYENDVPTLGMACNAALCILFIGNWFFALLYFYMICVSYDHLCMGIENNSLVLAQEKRIEREYKIGKTVRSEYIKKEKKGKGDKADKGDKGAKGDKADKADKEKSGSKKEKNDVEKNIKEPLLKKKKWILILSLGIFINQ